jgi:hypothetical protein
MIKVDLSRLPIIAPELAAFLTGADVSDFDTPGYYHVVGGSRGEIEEVNFLDDVDEIEVPTIEEILGEDADDEDEYEALEEWYCLIEDENSVSFSAGEEHVEYWVRVDEHKPGFVLQPWTE